MESCSTHEIFASPPVMRVELFMRRICRIFAALGGILLTALTLMTVISVVKRSFFGAPIPGDFELVELGVAVSVSFFLPYCQIQDGNVIVDIFTAKAPEGVIRVLGVVGDLLLMLISAVLCWRLVHGCIEYREYEDVTMVLQIPIWWAMIPMIFAFALLTLTCATTLLGRIFSPAKAKSAIEREAAAIAPELFGQGKEVPNE